MRSNAEWLDLFLDMLTAERGAAAHTLSAYKTDLKGFIGWYGRDVVGATTAELREYVATFEEQGFARSSICRKISAIRRFYHFLQQEAAMTANPATLLAFPRTVRPLPKILSEAEVASLLAAASADPSPRGLRLVALLEILYGCGLRVSELISLPLATVMRDPAFLVVTGKGNKERLVPLTDAARDAIKAYLPVRDTFVGSRKKTSVWLFPSRSAQGHLTRQQFGLILKDVARRAGLEPERVSPHVLRHAFASHLLKYGADLRSIQAMLGHSDIATTQIYTHVENRQLSDVVEHCHPLGRQ